MAGSTLPDRVAQIYYTYGLFCSSYPITAVSLALSVLLLCCYPLLNVPLPGNIPTIINLPLNKEFPQTVNSDCSVKHCSHSGSVQLSEVLLNETQNIPYLWAKEKPLLYVHQIVMKIGVTPWNNNLRLWDAFRAPLQEVFRLLETVRNHEQPTEKTTLPQLCYQIEGLKRRDSKASQEHFMPEYACLLLSPANLWQQNLQSFSLDNSIVNTIYNHQKGKTSLAEMTFGLHLRDSGIKRYPLRARPRVLQYAVTIFYQRYDQRFMESLAHKLKEMYPLYQDTAYTYVDEMTLIYYPGQFNYRELVPLLITFIGIFLYVYFSVRKIEFIKSKFGLAACAVVTITGSLSMTMGICFYFGFSLSLQGKEVFPYLVIIVGLENVLVLTKSVTSTDTRLDVKIRLAQGLSKEGWSITQNFLTEITIFTVSFFTFVPFIQEFSIFMIVSLLSDYFMQMVFFATILGIDVCRMEYFQDRNSKFQFKEFFANSALNWRVNKSYLDDKTDSPKIMTMTKSKSHPRLNGLAQSSPTDVVAKRKSNPNINDHRVPKRIRLVNMWARTRFFQRAFMLWMLVWISMIVYNSGVVDYFISNTDKTEVNEPRDEVHRKSVTKQSLNLYYNGTERTPLVLSPWIEIGDTERPMVYSNDTIMLKHTPNSRPWSRLSPYHWSSILSQYNESLAGRYLVILPPILISHRISPELAVTLRNPDEKDPPPLRWQALAAALDPIDTLQEFDMSEGKVQPNHQWGKGSDLPIYPTTPMEILLLAILCTISVAVIAYMMVVLYRCVCSRNYAEWRASWNEDDENIKNLSKQPAVQLMMEAVPLVVSGHSQEVECIVTDGEKVVSSCLQGNIKVWDSQNGELITNIDRGAFFKLQQDLCAKVNSKRNTYQCNTTIVPLRNELNTNSESQSVLTGRGISNHLTGLRFRSTNPETPSHMSAAESTKYDFVKSYRNVYCSDQPRDVHNFYEAKENADIGNINKSNKSELNYNRFKNSDKLNENRTHLFNASEDSSLCALDHKPKNICINSDTCDIVSSIEHNKELVTNLNWKGNVIRESPIWCMDFCNDLIILGCADGRLEFWEASTGKLMCIWRSAECNAGITHVRTVEGARRVCVGSLSGHLTLLRLDAYNAASGAHVDWRFSTAHRRNHKRTGSAGSRTTFGLEDEPNRIRTMFSYDTDLSDGEEIICIRLAHCRPHQQPITELHCDGGRIVTGGQDHILKVFSSIELNPLFTLHGHCGPITSCFIDHTNPTIGGSGSQDGLLCVWDLHTGTCLYSMQAHDGAVTSLAYTASYVVSAGADERLCIWDRFQGHMLNSIHIGLNYMSRMLPLTHTLLIMGDRNGLTAYDLSSGDVIRRVLLGQSDGCIFVRQILPLKDAIVCDYANQLRIVRFPLVSRLSDMKND